MPDRAPKLLILGTRGIPAAHGGFETFAERLALYLVERGWQVGVYCQRDVETVRDRIVRSAWNGVELITVEIGLRGPVATLAFDAICARAAPSRPSRTPAIPRRPMSGRRPSASRRTATSSRSPASSRTTTS